MQTVKPRSLRFVLLAAALSIAGSGIAAAGPVAVDTCGMLSEATVAEAIGKAANAPQPQPANNAQLGGCEYTGAKGKTTLMAYPADQLDGTVRRDLKKGRAKAISGLGEKAYQTEYGVMFQQPGKSYFLTVFVMRGTDYDAAVSEALARKVKP